MRTIDEMCRDWLVLCESHIERLFLEAAINMGWVSKYERTLSHDDRGTLHYLLHSDAVSMWIHPKLVGTSGRIYKVDFALAASSRNPGKALAIECDGHDYHERTKEQARSDRSRDRDLLGNGLPVVRFTGSEIVRNSQACVREAYRLLEARMAS